MKKIIPITLSAMLLGASLCSVAVAKEFSDVPTSHWAYTYVNDLSDKGVIKGYSDGTFLPSGKITRAEYIKLLVSAIDSKEEEEAITSTLSTYANWFEPYVNYAKGRDLLLKDLSVDELKGNVSRNEMAQLLINFARYVGLGLETGDIDISKAKVSGKSPADAGNAPEVTEKKLKEVYDVEDGEELIIANNLNDLVTDSESNGEMQYDGEEMNNVGDETFSDLIGLTPDEQSSIELAVKLGLISGYDDGTFKPENEMTRAEVATIIYRFTNSFDKQEIEILPEE